MSKRSKPKGRPRTESSGLSERITITLPPSLMERIDHLAELNGQSRSYIIRRSLEETVPSMERMAQSLTDPFLGGLRRRFISMIAAAETDPSRARDIADILNKFELKSQQVKEDRKKKA